MKILIEKSNDKNIWINTLLKNVLTRITYYTGKEHSEPYIVWQLYVNDMF